MADTPLPVSESTSVLKALYDFIKGEYASIEWESLETEGISLGMFSQQGAKFFSKNILGGFVGIIPFYIAYRSSPQEDTDKIEMIDYLNAISDWIMTSDYPTFTDNRVIITVEPTSIPFMDEIMDNGTITYIQTYEMKYRKDV